jgi:Ca2+/Na+ antiporter
MWQAIRIVTAIKLYLIAVALLTIALQILVKGIGYGDFVIATTLAASITALTIAFVYLALALEQADFRGRVGNVILSVALFLILFMLTGALIANQSV